MIDNKEFILLGNSSVKVPRMGVGTWEWGDKMMWSFGKGYGEADIRKAFHMSISAGINFFDTAEIYGWGASEKYLGTFIREVNSEVIIATKYFPYPWRIPKYSLTKALLRSLQRLGVERVDLYQIHWPLHVMSLKTVMDGLADLAADNLVGAVGVSNYSADKMRRAQEYLAQRNVSLVSNQVEYSLFHRRPERDGVYNACRELGITLIAYSPLAMGLLTGKYSLAHPPDKRRVSRYGKKVMRKLEGFINLLKEIGEEHGGKSPAQVALNWLVNKGTLPIPGAKNGEQAEINAGALGWSLTNEAVQVLDKASQKIKR